MPAKTGRRCGLLPVCKFNDTSSVLCNGSTASGVIRGTNISDMQWRCAADTTCAGFGRCASHDIYNPLFSPFWNVSYEGGDVTCQTWIRQTGPAPPPPPTPYLCLATDRDGLTLRVEPCETDPEGCHVSRCTDSDRVRQLWYVSRSGQLLSSWAGPGTNDLPRCLATAPNHKPPQPPVPPPAANPGLPIQVWAGPLSGNRTAVVLSNASPNASTITAEWEMLGLASGTRVSVRDAIWHTDNGTSTGPSLSAMVGSHDVVVLVLTSLPEQLKTDDTTASTGETTSRTLRDYGYYYGMGSAISPVTHRMDNLEQFASHSTCAFLTDTRGSLSSLAEAHVAQLTELAARNMSGVLPITGVFWRNATALHANWSYNWAAYWSKIAPHAATISAFYPLDEPSPIAISSGLYGLTVAAIRQSAPQLPIAAIITQSAAKGIEYNAYDLPKEVNLIGFDAYGCWAQRECEQHHLCCWENRTVPHNLKVLKDYAQRRPGTKLVVVGDGLANSKPGPKPVVPTVAAQELVAEIDRNYFDWCDAEELCTTMWVFLWSSISLQSGWLVGVDEQQAILQPALVKIGSIIKDRSRYQELRFGSTDMTQL